MKLFEIDIDTNTIKLNREWIYLTPEFAALLRRDKGSDGDYDGRRKLKATKEFTFIYFYVDFASPLRDYEPSEKRKEALIYAQLTEADIDSVVDTALRKYEDMFLKAARSLRTYKALNKTLDAMDDFFENLDMDERDKKGELVHDPTAIVNSAKKMDEYYTALKNFAKRVEEELTQGATTIQGTRTLGDRESKGPDKWSEGEIAEKSERTSGGEAKSGGDFLALTKDIFIKNKQ
jgi:hypothetical protein